MFVQWKCHNINGVLGGCGMMCFITIASGWRGNKQASNWVANLGLKHKETWVGSTTTSLWEMGKKWFMKWASHVDWTMQHLAIDHTNNKNDWHKPSSPWQWKYWILSRVLYHGALKTRNQKVLRSLNPKPHLRIFKNLFWGWGIFFCWVQMLWVLMVQALNMSQLE